jgi:hypothetical protein
MELYVQRPINGGQVSLEPEDQIAAGATSLIRNWKERNNYIHVVVNVRCE